MLTSTINHPSVSSNLLDTASNLSSSIPSQSSSALSTTLNAESINGALLRSASSDSTSATTTDQQPSRQSPFTYLSDLDWTSAKNGWGAIEKDRSNGEKGARDGQTLTLNGKTYRKGLGAHANSTIEYNLDGKYSTFTSAIGVDDEVGAKGSLTFQVWADGSKLYDSGVMRGNTATKTINVNIAGKQTLKLIVTDAGNKQSFDHADWADAKLFVSATTQSPTPFPTTRDKWLWPFDSRSIWNMPIGSEANYKPANIKPVGVAIDENLLYQLKDGDPLRPVYMPGSWTDRDKPGGAYTGVSLPVPDNLIVPDAVTSPYYSTPNNAAAFLMPDGETLVQIEPLARTKVGGPLYGYHYYQDLSIYGEGAGGSHFGSGLSAIGGTIRLGELTGNEPIRHALKIELWGEKYYHYSETGKGFKWPAIKADGGAPFTYHGTNPDLKQGALLAISPDVTEASLGLQTPAGKKIFHALQNYGAYVVDDTGYSPVQICAEDGVTEEFQKTYGYSLASSGDDNPMKSDWDRMLPALDIIVNNGPNSIGGGGTPRQPLAPPIGN